MITLGIELSSRRGSLALLRDRTVLAETAWLGEHARHGALFDRLAVLLAEAGVGFGAVDCYAVGRGPGSFSGMRTAFAAAQALALPDRKEVRAVSSGAALALAAARETGARRIAVAGDARRGQLWLAEFEAEGGGVVLRTDWHLTPYAGAAVAEGTLLASPEAERLAQWFPQIGPARFPQARHVAELALDGSEPLEPLYMHPPVFIEPKFG